jgi:hypothetical protein
MSPTAARGFAGIRSATRFSSELSWTPAGSCRSRRRRSRSGSGRGAGASSGSASRGAVGGNSSDSKPSAALSGPAEGSDARAGRDRESSTCATRNIRQSDLADTYAGSSVEDTHPEESAPLGAAVCAALRGVSYRPRGPTSFGGRGTAPAGVSASLQAVAGGGDGVRPIPVHQRLDARPERRARRQGSPSGGGGSRRPSSRGR